MKPTQLLEKLIKEQAVPLKGSYIGPSYHVVQFIIRRIDIIFPLFGDSDNHTESEVQEIRELFNFGWAPLLKQYYSNIDLNVVQSYPFMNNDIVNWADSNILQSGRVEFCKQILSYEKAGLIKLQCKNETDFTFSYTYKNSGLEQLDNKSLSFFKNEIIEEIIKKEKVQNPFNEIKIHEELKKVIKCMKGNLISYEINPEIDQFYRQKGHFHVLRMQGYDDFSPTDCFGSLKYSQYLQVIELAVGAAIMHLDACLVFVKRYKNSNLNDILSHTYSKEKTIKMYADYLGRPIEEMNQIFSCITLTKENYDSYLDFPAPAPPMYLHVSNDIIVRSISGCLTNPFSLLNRELKRKYKKDYDKAVNRREDRFRNELFVFFPDDRIIKIPKEINISFKNIKTDIDAVVFDKITGTLGLIQLKWQDPYTNSMKERYSRMSNLFPKASEWVKKMQFWIENNSNKDIISSLQIDRHTSNATDIKDIYIFVISRNTLNFTGMNVDDSVAWSSWHQLIEAQTKVGTIINDPIKEMFMKIKFLSPHNRPDKEEILNFEEYEMKIGNSKLSFINEKNK